MSQEARISALEYLLAELLRELRDRDGKPIESIIRRTQKQLLDSEGPGNPDTKKAAHDALRNVTDRL